MERPELCRGSVEFVAPAAFLQKPISDPCTLFVVDVSSSSIATGLVSTTVQSIKQSLDAMARNQRLRVGIITYDSALHFYSLKPPRTEPQMYVVSDVDDVFVPCPPEELLVTVADPKCRALIDATLDMIGSVFSSDNAASKGAAKADAKDSKSAAPNANGINNKFNPFGQSGAAAASTAGAPKPFNPFNPTPAAPLTSTDQKDSKSGPALFGTFPPDQSSGGESDNEYGSALGAAATAANLALV